MEQQKENKKTADKLSRYICIFVYIYLYPAIYTVLFYCFDDLHPILYFYSDAIDFTFWGTSILFIPALLWLIVTKIFKKIHPAITIIYFLLFVIMQFMALFFIFFMNALNNAE